MKKQHPSPTNLVRTDEPGWTPGKPHLSVLLLQKGIKRSPITAKVRCNYRYERRHMQLMEISAPKPTEVKMTGK